MSLLRAPDPLLSLSPAEREAVCGRLLVDWFSVHARALPWREDYDPYKVLVSEFMLQQTQVETVLVEAVFFPEQNRSKPF